MDGGKKDYPELNAGAALGADFSAITTLIL